MEQRWWTTFRQGELPSSVVIWNTGDELEFLYPSAIFDVLDKLYSRMPRCYFPRLSISVEKFFPVSYDLPVSYTNNLDFYEGIFFFVFFFFFF